MPNERNDKIMKVFCISDNIETAVGLKLTGIDTEVLKEKEEILKKITEIEESENVGILVLTENIHEKVEKEVEEIRNNKKLPLIVTIPNNPNLN